MNVHESHRTVVPRSMSDFASLDSPRRKSAPETTGKAPPPRPSKPLALRGLTTTGAPKLPDDPSRPSAPPPPRSRKSLNMHDSSAVHPLSQTQSSADISDPNAGYLSSARQKVSAAYNSLPEIRSHISGTTARTSSRPRPHSEASNSTDSDRPPPPPPRRGVVKSAAANASNRLSWGESSEDEYFPSNNTAVPVDKKVELWRRRWKRAKDILDSRGVALRSWRVGGDVCLEAVQMIEKTMTEMGVEGYGRADGKGKAKGKTGEGGGEIKVKDIKR